MLELWFDFSCPYAYLASRLAPRLGVEIDWRPMLLGGVFRGIGAGDGPMATLSPQRAAHNFHDMHRWAAHLGVPFQLPAAHPMRDRPGAADACSPSPTPGGPTRSDALYAAYWQRAEDITRDDVITVALGAAGVSEDDIGAALARADDPAIKTELRERTDEAIALGIFGAPAWILRRPAGPLLIWGQDRLAWIEAALAGWDPDAPGRRRVARARSRASTLRPGRRTRPPRPRRSTSTSTSASPFAYLGLTQLPALARATGVTPRLVPILARRAVQATSGRRTSRGSRCRPRSSATSALEMARWARWWGEPFDLPRKFPQRTITAQRLCLLAADRGFDPGVTLATALARAMWAEQRDVEDPDGPARDPRALRAAARVGRALRRGRAQGAAGRDHGRREGRRRVRRADVRGRRCAPVLGTGPARARHQGARRLDAERRARRARRARRDP